LSTRKTDGLAGNPEEDSTNTSEPYQLAASKACRGFLIQGSVTAHPPEVLNVERS
jgi:hypothetical protein